MKSFNQSIIDGDYDNKMPYPSNNIKPALKAIDNAERTGVISSKAANTQRNAFDRSNTVYKRARDAYATETQRLMGKFTQDLYVEHGVQDNPKRDKAFSLAWEMGHSSGFHDVASNFADLVDLIS